MDPVLIVGAGPVGLSLALSLVRQGVPVEILDQRTGVAQDPRATTLQPPVLECFASWGVLQAAQEAGLVVRGLQYWNWERHRRLVDLDYARIDADTSTPYRIHLSHQGICQVLIDALEAEQPGLVRWGHKAAAYVDQGTHVTITSETRDGHVSVLRGSYLVAADGVNSTVRQQLGIPFDDVGPTQSFTIAQLDRSARKQLATLGGEPLAPVCYLYLHQGWAMTMEMADHVRVLFHRSDAAVDDVGAEGMRLHAHELLGADADPSLLRGIAHYKVRPRLAASLRQGRAFLVGDAAHSAYPVGGTSMNAGILDAHYLGLAIGCGDPSALDTYDADRRSWVQRHLLQATSDTMGQMKARWPWTRAYRSWAMTGIADTPETERQHLLRVSLLGDRID